MSNEVEKNPQENPAPERLRDIIPIEGGLISPTRVIVQRVMQMQINDGYVLRKVGQAFMVMPTGARMKEYQGMITLNDTGAFLFEQMKKPDVTRDDLVEACKAEYGATEDEANQAIDSFLAQASECNLVPYADIYIDLKTQQPIPKEEAEVIIREEAEAEAKRMQEIEKEKKANESEQSKQPDGE